MKALTLFGGGSAHGAVPLLEGHALGTWGWVALVGGRRRRCCSPILAWVYVYCLEMDSRRWRSSAGVVVASMAEDLPRSRRWRSSFGVVVASMAEDLPRLSPQSTLKMDQWKTAATAHVSATDRFEPRTRQMARAGPPALDVSLR